MVTPLVRNTGGQLRTASDDVVLEEPVEVVEGRVGKDVVGAEVRMEVVAEGVGLLGAEVGLFAAQGDTDERGGIEGVVILNGPTYRRQHGVVGLVGLRFGVQFCCGALRFIYE